MNPGSQERLRRHVDALCSERCAGRDAGSAEGRAARAYIEAVLRDAGIRPERQRVPGSRGTNVWARLGRPGGPVILLAAHYDHIGTAGWGEAYWGADDNAAAVAVLLEVAHVFARTDVAADLWIVFFDAEEPPHFLTPDMGAMEFVAKPPLALASIGLAVVLDLVGHAVGPASAPDEVRRSLFALGTEKSDQAGPILRAAAEGATEVVVRELDLDVVPPLSDYEPLRRHGVPVLFLSCGRWEHYHEITDTPDRLDYPKIAATTELVARLVREAARYGGPWSRYLDGATNRRGTAEALARVAAALDAGHPAVSSLRQSLEAVATAEPTAEDLDDTAWDEVKQLLHTLERGLRAT